MRCSGFSLTTFVYCAVFLLRTTGQSDKDPLSGFERFEVIHPKVINHSSRHKRDLSSSPEEHMKSDKISVEFQSFKRIFHLKLTKNKELFAPHYKEMSQENGKYITDINIIQSENNCHYRGRLRGYENSWASINICHGLSGVIFDGTQSFHLHYYENISEIVNIILKTSEMKPLNVSCGSENLQHEWNLNGTPILNRFRRFSEWQFSHLGKNRRILELFIVADRSMFLRFRRQREAVSRRVREIINIVHGLYIQLNIVVVLVGLQLWNEKDEIRVSSDASRTLNEFTDHGNDIIRDYHCDDVQLITDVNFNKPTVGLAFVGSICKFEKATGVNQDYSALVTAAATTVAHEIGHNFNMEHDEAHCKCPNKNCIMGSHGVTGDFQWSSCSIEALTTYLNGGVDSCLKNIPKEIVLPVCGDGVIQHDEQCDCGQPRVCDNPCCNATTCQLYENAICAAGSCCDLETCKPKEIATPCREKQSECDLPEFCDGRSPICPDDVLVQDGTKCGFGKAFCFQGGCQSHDDQCHLVWGSEAKSADLCCYKHKPPKGSMTDNCGTDRSRKTFPKCPKKYALCGALKCDLDQRETVKPKYIVNRGMKEAWSSSTCHTTGQSSMSRCLSYFIKSGPLKEDPALVPSGAKCGDNMMCFKQKCVDVETVRRPRCPTNCSGNGVCNSKGNCHCIVGFGSSACDSSGPGGSVDSGPLSDPNAGRNYVTVMYVIFFGVCPLVLTTVSAIYFFCFVAPKIAAMERCKQEQPNRGKEPTFRASLKRLPKLSLRSMSEDVSYDSFTSSDEETSMSVSAKPLPDIPRNPPRIHVLRRNKVSESRVQTRAPIKPTAKDSSGIPSKDVRRPQRQVPPLRRKESQSSIHEGIILKVPDPKATDKSVGERQLKRWNDESQHQQAVVQLAKLFEKK